MCTYLAKEYTCRHRRITHKLCPYPLHLRLLAFIRRLGCTKVVVTSYADHECRECRRQRRQQAVEYRRSVCRLPDPPRPRETGGGATPPWMTRMWWVNRGSRHRQSQPRHPAREVWESWLRGMGGRNGQGGPTPSTTTAGDAYDVPRGSGPLRIYARLPVLDTESPSRPNSPSIFDVSSTLSPLPAHGRELRRMQGMQRLSAVDRPGSRRPPAAECSLETGWAQFSRLLTRGERSAVYLQSFAWEGSPPGSAPPAPEPVARPPPACRHSYSGQFSALQPDDPRLSCPQPRRDRPQHPENPPSAWPREQPPSTPQRPIPTVQVTPPSPEEAPRDVFGSDERETDPSDWSSGVHEAVAVRPGAARQRPRSVDLATPRPLRIGGGEVSQREDVEERLRGRSGRVSPSKVKATFM